MFKRIKVFTFNSLINALVLYNNKYYIVSDNGYGCFIYKSDCTGEVSDWRELVCLDGAMLGDIVKDKTCFSLNLRKNLTPPTTRVRL